MEIKVYFDKLNRPFWTCFSKPGIQDVCLRSEVCGNTHLHHTCHVGDVHYGGDLSYTSYILWATENTDLEVYVKLILAVDPTARISFT